MIECGVYVRVCIDGWAGEYIERGKLFKQPQGML